MTREERKQERRGEETEHSDRLASRPYKGTATHEAPPEGKEEHVVLHAVLGSEVALEGRLRHPFSGSVLKLMGDEEVSQTVTDEPASAHSHLISACWVVRSRTD